MSIGYNPFDEDFSIEEFQEYRTMAYSLREENLRLKKKVDELTDKLGEVLMSIKMDELLVAKGVERAIKETVEEIWRHIVDSFLMREENKHFFKKWLVECYDVEVE